jgi:signal transduction histidine kinase
MAPGCAFDLVVSGEFPGSLSGPVGIEIVRIVQEALANVRRHSGARRATVTLGIVDDEAWVEVEDDGRGFDPGEDPGMGLTGMRERTLVLGGSLEVESEREMGTRVRLRVPLLVLMDANSRYSNARE